jgi:antitoxin HigA-1
MNKKKHRPRQPGEILKYDFMLPKGMSQQHLADLIGIPRSRIQDVISGRRSITTDTAIRLSRLFETTIEFWLYSQIAVDIWDKMKDGEEEYKKIKPIGNFRFVNQYPEE